MARRSRAIMAAVRSPHRAAASMKSISVNESTLADVHPGETNQRPWQHGQSPRLTGEVGVRASRRERNVLVEKLDARHQGNDRWNHRTHVVRGLCVLESGERPPQQLG